MYVLVNKLDVVGKRPRCTSSSARFCNREPFWRDYLELLMNHTNKISAFFCNVHLLNAKQNKSSCERTQNLMQGNTKLIMRERKTWCKWTQSSMWGNTEFIVKEPTTYCKNFQKCKAHCVLLQVNLDSKTRDLTLQLLQAPSHTSLSHAQKRIYSLLDTDCYPRFLQSNIYLSLLREAD